MVDNLIEHIGKNESNYFMYRWEGTVDSPHPSELLHLNQAGVQHLISNLTNTYASSL